MSNDKPTWVTISPASLTGAIADDYAAYKAAYAAMKAHRETFEASLRTVIACPKGQRVAINYNFGKLSVAFVADDAKPASGKGAVSLASLAR